MSSDEDDELPSSLFTQPQETENLVKGFFELEPEVIVEPGVIISADEASDGSANSLVTETSQPVDSRSYHRALSPTAFLPCRLCGK